MIKKERKRILGPKNIRIRPLISKKPAPRRASELYLDGFPVWSMQKPVDIESFKLDVSKQYLQFPGLGDCSCEYLMAGKRIATAWIL